MLCAQNTMESEAGLSLWHESIDSESANDVHAIHKYSLLTYHTCIQYCTCFKLVIIPSIIKLVFAIISKAF